MNMHIAQNLLIFKSLFSKLLRVPVVILASLSFQNRFNIIEIIGSTVKLVA